MELRLWRGNDRFLSGVQCVCGLERLPARSDTPSARSWSSELRSASGDVASTADRSPPPLKTDQRYSTLSTYALLATATTPAIQTVTSNCCYTRACGPTGADSLRLRRPY
eukprot:COSAG02_NODE_17_length_55377_cov_106.402258_42_plen_110_part_00